MRLTADEWLRLFQRNLSTGAGEAGQPAVVRVTTSAFVSDDGPQKPVDQPFDTHRFTFSAGGAGDFAQVIPRGYYDTIVASWVSVTNTVFQERPILIFPELLVPAEGVYTLTTLGVTLSTFFRNHPPLATRPSAGVTAGTSQTPGCGSLIVKTTYTNQPVAVMFSDMLSPAGSETFAARVTLMSVRH